MNDVEILEGLTRDAEALYSRHLSMTKEWFPHQDLPAMPGAGARSEDACPDAAVGSALLVNLLTEDNLPYYFRTLSRLLGNDGVFGEWTRRWTAEEGRHSMAIYSYLIMTRSVDLVALERARMIQVSQGLTPEPSTLADGLVYLTLQELATRIAHHNTGRMMSDVAGRRIMTRVAADENLHFLFYRDLTSAAIEIDPSSMVKAMERQVRHFEMPGAGIPGFAGHAAAIARAGIYDLAIHHHQILEPVVLGRWHLHDLTGLDTAAEEARDRLVRRLARSGRVADRLIERRETPRALTSIAD